MAINLPNILTITRILLTPLFIIYLLKDMYMFALLVFTVAAVSDGLDGLLARCFNQRTVLGAYLDPIADKLLLTSAFISLAVLKIIPAWVTVLVITRDVLIVIGLSIFTLRDIDFEIQPSIASKLTTVVQLSTIFFTLLDMKLETLLTVKYTFYWVTAILTIISGLHYIYLGMNILQDTSPPKNI
ncbi:MAG: CDP-alcohol phosphatidyltransferase family protein [Desulfobacterales bacterium]|nr:CDP-alcohol phosphatidyltransferase family protein [Desulfobacterales bacterium]